MNAFRQRAKGKFKPKMRMAILITLLATVFVTVSILNLRAGEKQIRYELPHRFGVEDLQFTQGGSCLATTGLEDAIRLGLAEARLRVVGNAKNRPA